MSTPRRAVYRALMGGYEQLREEEVAHDSDLPFICFTDDPSLTSKTWQIEVVEPRVLRDSTRSARALKIIGHPLLEEFDETLWVDNTVALTQPPDELLETWLEEADVAAPLHDYRTSVLGEAEAVVDSGLDDVALVYTQIAHYLATAGESLEENPHWTGMLARRRTPVVQAAMTTWWEDVLRFSRRDQLSFMPAVRRHGVRLASVPFPTHTSQWHDWPRSVGRDISRRGPGLRELLQPPALRIGELEQALDAATTTMASAVAGREAEIARLTTSLADTGHELASVRAELDTVRHERNLAHIDLAASRDQVARLKASVEQKSQRLRRLRRRVRLLQERETAEPAHLPWWRNAVASVRRPVR